MFNFVNLFSGATKEILDSFLSDERIDRAHLWWRGVHLSRLQMGKDTTRYCKRPVVVLVTSHVGNVIICPQLQHIPFRTQNLPYITFRRGRYKLLGNKLRLRAFRTFHSVSGISHHFFLLHNKLH